MVSYTIIYLGTVGSGLPSVYAAETLNIYNWEAYMASSVIEKLKTKHDITLVESYFSDETLRDELLLSERKSSYDLVIVESVRLKQLAGQGVFHNLSKMLTELDHSYDPRWMSACGDYGIPYAWGTSGILYRESAFVTPVDSWKTLLIPDARLKGRVGMYYDPIEAIAPALLALNADPFTSDKTLLKSAYRTLKAQRPFLAMDQYILSSISTPNKLKNIDIAYGFSPDVVVLNELESNDDWRFVVPKEGGLIWLDCMASPSGKPMKKGTWQVMTFLSKAKIAAENAKISGFLTPTLGVLSLNVGTSKDDTSLLSPLERLDQSFLYRHIDAQNMRYRDRMMNTLRD
ncbi:hypothetical protein BCU70_10410 [Vibrio sp. 10N.286.49.C2]|nr:hypothetical protein BCU70_10410 [Vibrio sp. 10N.286.49.C2]PMH51313.1 hypothetical protein BCU66_17355 [Vibrio sp. 10N.286.49.B1]PMH81601.1 hypothetical protein BCU58_02535 [Vibrio sp. 10N.286.48.B7]